MSPIESDLQEPGYDEDRQRGPCPCAVVRSSERRGLWHYGDARAAAPGWDVYVLEQEWRVWLATNEITPNLRIPPEYAPNHPEKHFLKFCASWYAKRRRK